MHVTVLFDVDKNDIENLSQALEKTSDLELRSFIERFLKKTQETTDSMIKAASSISDSNPFSVGFHM